MTQAKKISASCLIALLLWGGIIVLSLFLEWLFNSGTQSGSGGMGIVSPFLITALYLGWIPAGILARKISRKWHE